MLAPIVFVIGVFYARSKARSQAGGNRKQVNYFALFPKFVLGFLALALLRTLGWLPDFTVQLPHAAGLGHFEGNFSMTDATKWGANFCIVMSMAGVGLETKFAAMRQSGLRPFVAAAVSALAIALAVLGLIKLLAIG
jgi:uncharacterized membrane protein YadS